MTIAHFNMGDSFFVPDYRDLNSDERTLLEWLLANSPADVAQFAEQLPQVKVISHCGCGCPTIDLAVGDRMSRTHGATTILANARGVSPENIEVDVILHARENQLSELEVYSIDGTAKFSLPKPESLQVY